MNRVLGAIHILIAAAVGVYFMMFPLIADSAGHSVWTVLEWAMALTVVSSVFFAFAWMRGLDEDASTKEFITYKILFFGAALLVLWYFPAWFAELGGSGRSEAMEALSASFWLLVDPLFVLTVGPVGYRLWARG